MTQMTSGKVLRETRERKGYDLTTVARRLRIRPDILRAIEAGDFASMPPRGYTRNMVNAYARLLGLNPTEIVNMYLDEAYAVEVERARDRAPVSGFNMERESFRSRSGESSRSRGRSNSRSRGRSRGDVGSYDETTRQSSSPDGRYGRRLYDDRTKYSRDDYGITREKMDRPGISDRDFLSHHSGYTSTDYGFLDNGSGRGRAVHVGETPMQYKASRLPGFLQSRFALIAIIAVIVIAAVVIAFFVLGNRNAPQTNDVSQLPVSGISDTTGIADDEDTTGMVEVAPSSSHVVITVKQGDECYLETYAGSVTTPYMLYGPAEENIEVIDKLTVATWTPEYVTVTVDNMPVELTSDDSLGGMYSYTVDFPAILEEWRATHTSNEAKRSAAMANATNGAEATSEEAAESSTSEG